MPDAEILFLCSGNICRSPIGEYMFRRELGFETRWRVSSAGVTAIDGLPASSEAVDVLAEQGIDASGHRSRRLTGAMVDSVSLIVVMTRQHIHAVLTLFPQARNKTYLVKAFAKDSASKEEILDPIGLPIEAYRLVSSEIEAAMPGLIEYLNENDRD